MPVLGMSQDHGVLVRWLARSGDEVLAGAPLMEVETDKAVVEVDAPATGVLSGITLAEGESAAVGTVIARIYAKGETPPSDEGSAARSREAAHRGGAVGAVAATSATVPAESSGAAPSAAAGSRPMRAAARPGRPGFVRSSPLARRLAGELGVDLAQLEGRGAGHEGAVVARDVFDASHRGPVPDTARSFPQEAAAASTARDARPPIGAPLDRGRDVVRLGVDIDLEPLRALAGRLGGGRGVGAGYGADDLLVMLVLLVLGGTLEARSSVAVRRTRDGDEQRSVWRGERPVLDWLLRSGDGDGDDSVAVEATVVDATRSRVRRSGGLGAQRFVVALAARADGGATIDVSVGERDAVAAERMLDDLVRVIEDPASAPFVLR